MQTIIGLTVAALFLVAASLLLYLEHRENERERIWRGRQDLDALQRISNKATPEERTISPAASLARVGPFTPEEAQKHHERNYAALNGCLKAIEAAGLTLEEAQTIPAQLEKAVAFAIVRQFHASTFKAFTISREPDGKGGWKDEPAGYSSFTA